MDFFSRKSQVIEALDGKRRDKNADVAVCNEISSLVDQFTFDDDRFNEVNEVTKSMEILCPFLGLSIKKK